MKTTTKCLLVRRRTDGKFLRLNRQRHSTSYDFVEDAELGERITFTSFVSDKDINKECLHPHEATYYFENSDRAINSWLVDCEMVGYEIVTDVSAVEIKGGES